VAASLVLIDILLRRQPRIAYDALRLAFFITSRFTRHQLLPLIVAVNEMWFSRRLCVSKQVCQIRRRLVTVLFGGQNLARRVV